MCSYQHECIGSVRRASQELGAACNLCDMNFVSKHAVDAAWQAPKNDRLGYDMLRVPAFTFMSGDQVRWLSVACTHSSDCPYLSCVLLLLTPPSIPVLVVLHLLPNASPSRTGAGPARFSLRCRFWKVPLQVGALSAAAACASVHPIVSLEVRVARCCGSQHNGGGTRAAKGEANSR